MIKFIFNLFEPYKAAHCFPSKYNEENFVARIGDYYNRNGDDNDNIYSQIESGWSLK